MEKSETNELEALGNYVVTPDVARATVNKWLDYKRVRQNKRKSYEDAIENMVEGVQEGLLILDEKDFTFTMKLLHPAGENGAISQFSLRPRMDMEYIRDYTKDVKAGDNEGRLRAYCAALASKLPAMISKLDTEDYNLLSSVATFFF